MQKAGQRSEMNARNDIVHFKQARIDLRVYADISRVIPPHLNLAETERQQGLPKLTDYPVMHLLQSRDLQLELDEIKKAIQHDVWTLFQQWHPRSCFHLTVDYYNYEENKTVAHKAGYDNTIQEVINQIQPLNPQAPLERLKFSAVPNDWVLSM